MHILCPPDPSFSLQGPAAVPQPGCPSLPGPGVSLSRRTRTSAAPDPARIPLGPRRSRPRSRSSARPRERRGSFRGSGSAPIGPRAGLNAADSNGPGPAARALRHRHHRHRHRRDRHHRDRHRHRHHRDPGLPQPGALGGNGNVNDPSGTWATRTVPRKALRVGREKSLRRGFTVAHADLQPSCFILCDPRVIFTLERGLSASSALASENCCCSRACFPRSPVLPATWPHFLESCQSPENKCAAGSALAVWKRSKVEFCLLEVNGMGVAPVLSLQC